MPARSVRLTADEETKETEVFNFYGVRGKTYSEQYRDFIVKIHKAMRLTAVIDAPDNPAVHPTPNITVRRCPLRKTITITHKDKKTGATLWTEKQNVCVNNPPQKTVIDDLAICEVCLEKFYGNTKRILAANPNYVPIKSIEQSQDVPEPKEVEVFEKPITASIPKQVTTPIPPTPEPSNWEPVQGYEKQLGLGRADGSFYCPFKDCFIHKADCIDPRFGCKTVFRDRYTACVKLMQDNAAKPTQKQR
jgi:hypothetical protein